MLTDQTPDDVDQLFAHLERLDPPEDLLGRVLSHVGEASPQWPARNALGAALVYIAAYLFAVIGLGVVAYELGDSIARNGAGVLVSTLASHAQLFFDQPGAFAGAISASIPWLQVVLLVLDLTVLVVATRSLAPGAPVSVSERRRAQ